MHCARLEGDRERRVLGKTRIASFAISKVVQLIVNPPETHIETFFSCGPFLQSIEVNEGLYDIYLEILF